MDRFRLPDFTTTKAARLSAAGRRQRRRCVRGDKPFIMHPDGFGWIWVASGLKEGPCQRTTSRSNRRSRNELYPEHAPIRPANDRASRQSVCRFARSALPVCADDVSADRASHGGRNVALAVASGGTAAGALLRNLAGTGGRGWESRTGSWVTVITPRGAIEARALVTRANEADARGRANHSSSRLAIPLGIQRARQGRRCERSGGDIGGAERAHHGNKALMCNVDTRWRHAAAEAVAKIRKNGESRQRWQA